MDLDLDLDLTPPDLRLGLDTSGLDFFYFLVLIFKVLLHFSLIENPDSQSEILNHLLLKSIRADPIGSSLFSTPLWC